MSKVQENKGNRMLMVYVPRREAKDKNIHKGDNVKVILTKIEDGVLNASKINEP